MLKRPLFLSCFLRVEKQPQFLRENRPVFILFTHRTDISVIFSYFLFWERTRDLRPVRDIILGNNGPDSKADRFEKNKS